MNIYEDLLAILLMIGKVVLFLAVMLSTYWFLLILIGFCGSLVTWNWNIFLDFFKFWIPNVKTGCRITSLIFTIMGAAFYINDEIL